MWTETSELRLHAMVSTAAAPWSGTVPVVLVHGLGLSHRYMMPTAECLAPHFHVYVPDLAGFGESGHPDRVLDISGLADALITWMDAIGLDRVALLGNSHACQIIIDLAARYPERLTRGVLQGPTTPPEERSWLWQFIRWRQNAPYNPKALDPITWPEYRKSGYLRVLRTFHYSLLDRPEERAPFVQAPMLVLRGQVDPICHENWAELLARLLPNGRIAIVPDVAHTLCFTAPVALATITKQFFEEKPS